MNTERIILYCFSFALWISLVGSIQSQDLSEIRQMADAHLLKVPLTVTSFPAERSEGGPNDYYSEGTYWWPDSSNLDGPYVRRDGLRNPQNFNEHHEALRELNRAMTALVTAYKFTKETTYLKHAVKHLRAWFVDPSTRMNPSLRFSQAIKGRNKGRYIGIIDTSQLVNVARAIEYLISVGVLEELTQSKVVSWFDEYATWLVKSEFGQGEQHHGNNHSTWWTVQVAAFSRVAGRDDYLQLCRNHYKDMLSIQMAEDGSFPKELARTKPFAYSLMNLDAWAKLTYLLSDDEDPLWTYEHDGRSLQLGMKYMMPFVQDKGKWPHQKDIAGHEKQPGARYFPHFAKLFYGKEVSEFGVNTRFQWEKDSAYHLWFE